MTSKTQIIGLLLVVTFLGGSFGFFASYLIYTPQITELKNNIVIAQIINQDLRANFTKLYTENQNTLSQYQSLSNLHSQVQLQKNILENQVNQKNSQIQELQTQYNTLNQKMTMDNLLRIYNDLTSFYDYVRDAYGLAGDKMGYSTGSQIKFASQLAYHDLGNNVWPSQETLYYQDVGSYSYTSASKIIDTAITYCDINNFDDSPTKIKKILDFIHMRISYRSEIDNIYRAPVETMSIASGDCDDFSVLAGALFTKVGIESAFSFNKNSNDEYHSMILVHLDKLGSYGFYSYKDLTSLGLKPGIWIVIEPQSTIEQQRNETWMSQWQIMYASFIGP